MTATPSIMCNHCSDALHQHGQICQCKNLAILYDADGTLRIYVDDITTARRVLVYYTDQQQEVSRELLRPFNQEVYSDYSYVANNSITFKPLAPDNSYTRITDTKYNTKLIQALDLYKITTSDGDEDFLATAKTDPKQT